MTPFVKILLAVYFLSSVFAVTTRASNTDTTCKTDFSKRIFIEPLALIDIYNASSLRVGVEWPVRRDFCSVFGVCGLYNKGVCGRVGVKMYGHTLFNKKRATTAYASLQLFYKSQMFTVDDAIDKPDNTPGDPVYYNVEKHVAAMHLEIGYVHAFRRLCIEEYGGVGVRISTVSRSINDSLFYSLYDINEGYVNHIGNSDKRNAVLPSITFGVRVCYLFKTPPRQYPDNAFIDKSKKRLRKIENL